MFRDVLRCYQAIADELSRATRQPWQRIDVEVEITGNSSIETEVIYTTPEGRRVSAAAAGMAPLYFFELGKLVGSDDKGLFKGCHVALSRDGKFDVDFRY